MKCSNTTPIQLLAILLIFISKLIVSLTSSTNKTIATNNNELGCAQIHAKSSHCLNHGRADNNRNSTITLRETSNNNKQLSPARKQHVAGTINTENSESIRRRRKIQNPTNNAKNIVGERILIPPKQLNVPKDSKLKLTVQLSRTDVFPGLFRGTEGFVSDGIIEVPVELKIDKFAEAMYGYSEESGRSAVKGFERCILYKWAIQWFTNTFKVPQALAKQCLLKSICEIQFMHAHFPYYPTSVGFDLLHSLFSPSLNLMDGCISDYLEAEHHGVYQGPCNQFESCPLDIARFLLKNFFKGHKNLKL